MISPARPNPITSSATRMALEHLYLIKHPIFKRYSGNESCKLPRFGADELQPTPPLTRETDRDDWFRDVESSVRAAMPPPPGLKRFKFFRWTISIERNEA